MDGTTAETKPQETWTERLFDQHYLLTEGLLFADNTTNTECDLVLRCLQLQPQERILDLACGHGRHALWLAARGFGAVVGLDYSKDAIAYARQAAHKQGLKAQFVEGDMRNLGFNNEFDAVYNVFSSMFYWDDAVHLEILRGVWRALRPGGQVLIDVYNRDAKVAQKILDTHRVVGPLRRARRVLGLFKRRVLHWWRRNSTPFASASNDSVFDPVSGVIRGVKRMKIAGQAPLEQRFAVRLHTVAELQGLLQDAGFVVEQWVSSPDGGALRLSSPRWIVVARKPQT